MNRPTILLAVLAALHLPGTVGAQQSLPTDPPPNPHQVVPDHRLEVADQKLLTAGEQLRRASEAGDADRAERALGYGRQTIREVRDVFDDLPQARRTPYEEAFLQAEQALQINDPAAGADAMQELQQKLRELVQRGA
jgi:hypothetical protein